MKDMDQDTLRDIPLQDLDHQGRFRYELQNGPDPLAMGASVYREKQSDMRRKNGIILGLVCFLIVLGVVAVALAFHHNADSSEIPMVTTTATEFHIDTTSLDMTELPKSLITTIITTTQPTTETVTSVETMRRKAKTSTLTYVSTETTTLLSTETTTQSPEPTTFVTVTSTETTRRKAKTKTTTLSPEPTTFVTATIITTLSISKHHPSASTVPVLSTITSLPSCEESGSPGAIYAGAEILFFNPSYERLLLGALDHAVAYLGLDIEGDQVELDGGPIRYPPVELDHLAMLSLFDCCLLGDTSLGASAALVLACRNGYTRTHGQPRCLDDLSYSYTYSQQATSFSNLATMVPTPVLLPHANAHSPDIS